MSRPFYFAITGLSVGLLGGVLSIFLELRLAWFIGGFLGIVPLWFGIPRERRVWWKALVAAIAAGALAGTVARILG